MAVAWSLLALAAATNMLPGGYKISNPNTLSPVAFTGEFTDEYFEVYSPPIRSEYAQVYWTLMAPVPLDPKMVQRFANKTIAITGYEIDQVRQTPQGDVPVPITHAYNHHYVAWLKSDYAEFVRRESKHDGNGMAHGDTHYWDTQPKKGAPVIGRDGKSVPLATVFSEGNGGEFRKSFHGYPKGYGQLIYSPTTFHVNPMQIDTMNRDHKDTAQFVPGPLPKTANSPVGANYSGLLECPCTDRLPKVLHHTYGLSTSTCGTPQIPDADGNCGNPGMPPTPCTQRHDPVKSAEACFAAAQEIAPVRSAQNLTKSDAALPLGCSVTVDAAAGITAVWNEAKSSTATCLAAAGARSKFGVAPSETQRSGEKTVAMNVSVDEKASLATLTLTGPAGAWFGVGLGADSMCIHPVADECPGGAPYAIIVVGDDVQEVKLGFGTGTPLQKMVAVTSSTVADGLRTVVLTRALAGVSDHHFSFDLRANDLPFISAQGKDLKYTAWPNPGYVAGHLSLVNTAAPACVCDLGVTGSLGGLPFHKSCPPPPLSDLAVQKNPTCAVDTYIGGLTCCRHLRYLLDADQEQPWKGDVLEYHLKYRFYFQEYSPKTIQPLVRLYHMTEANAGEYDIVKCKPGTPTNMCVQTITSRWSIQSMMNPCDTDTPARGGDAGGGWCTGIGTNDPTKYEGIQLIYAGPHCHAPSCISMELYNANTGELLCGMNAEFGKSTEVYDEFGYAVLPPCLWGSAADGLQEPITLPLETELLSIKKNNNTYTHTGEMASWQMRGVLVPKKAPGMPVELPKLPDLHV